MKKYYFTVLLILASFFLLYSWGFWAHKRINRVAVFTLPYEMVGFYKKHIEFVTEHAVDPDKRRYVLDIEGPRHYIDIDHYGKYPFQELPRGWDTASAKYSEDTLQAHGILPWHIERTFNYLVNVLKTDDVEKILRVSSDLGHYIADACVPLHCTVNYNGQLTGQKGIHGLWESRIPELFGDNYDYFVGKAVYIEEPLDAIWQVILQSALAVDSVCMLEKELGIRFQADKKYSYERKGNRTIRVYSQEYASSYHTVLNGMQERRMRLAIKMVGSFWYTAWVNAGQPDLLALQDKALKENEIERKNIDKLFKSGKIKGRKHIE